MQFREGKVSLKIFTIIIHRIYEYILSKTLISTTRWNHGWMDHGANCREDAKNEKLSVESPSVP